MGRYGPQPEKHHENQAQGEIADTRRNKVKNPEITFKKIG
jgi:hypothetical protein